MPTHTHYAAFATCNHHGQEATACGEDLDPDLVFATSHNSTSRPITCPGCIAWLEANPPPTRMGYPPRDPAGELRKARSVMLTATEYAGAKEVAGTSNGSRAIRLCMGLRS